MPTVSDADVKSSPDPCCEAKCAVTAVPISNLLSRGGPNVNATCLMSCSVEHHKKKGAGAATHFTGCKAVEKAIKEGRIIIGDHMKAVDKFNVNDRHVTGDESWKKHHDGEADEATTAHYYPKLVGL